MPMVVVGPCNSTSLLLVWQTPHTVGMLPFRGKDKARKRKEGRCYAIRMLTRKLRANEVNEHV